MTGSYAGEHWRHLDTAIGINC